MYAFPNLEPVRCSMSSSNCCFLTCIQISQEEGQMVWYSHPFKNFPQFVVIHTVKGFSIVNEAKVDVFLGLSCFVYDPTDVASLISGSSAFSKSMGFPRQEYWSGLPFPSPGDLPDPGIEPRSPTLQADSLPAEPQGKPQHPVDHRKSTEISEKYLLLLHWLC